MKHFNVLIIVFLMVSVECQSYCSGTIQSAVVSEFVNNYCTITSSSSSSLADVTFKESYYAFYNGGKFTWIRFYLPNIIGYLFSGGYIASNCVFELSDGSAVSITVFMINAGSNEFKSCNFSHIQLSNIDKSIGGSVFEIVHSEGTIIISQCIFDTCNVVGGCSGGCIYVNFADAYLSIMSCTFKNCSAEGNGGAIANTENSGEVISIVSCNFNNCSAVKGGAIFLSVSKTKLITVEGSNEFVNCKANDGGAVYLKVASDTGDIFKFSGMFSFTGCVANSNHGSHIFIEYTICKLSVVNISNFNYAWSTNEETIWMSNSITSESVIPYLVNNVNI
jgi:hypothetical protein